MESQNWIDAIAAEDALKATLAEARDQAALNASLVIRNDAPQFIHQVKLELDSLVVQLPKIGLTGAVSDFGQPDFELRYHLEVSKVGLPLPRLTDLNFFYLIGESHVRCHPRHSQQYNLHFGVRQKVLSMYDERRCEVQMNPEAVARFVMFPLVDFVRKGSFAG